MIDIKKLEEKEVVFISEKPSEKEDLEFNEFLNKNILQNKIKIHPDLKTLSNIIKNLKKDNIIKTNNIVGDLGEYYCKNLFNITLNKSTVEKGFDGIDSENNKVEIKTRRDPKGSAKIIFRGFDFTYCLFVELNDYFEPINIYKIYKREIVSNLDKKGDRMSVTKIKKVSSQIIYSN